MLMGVVKGFSNIFKFNIAFSLVSAGLNQRYTRRNLYEVSGWLQFCHALNFVRWIPTHMIYTAKLIK